MKFFLKEWNPNIWLKKYNCKFKYLIDDKTTGFMNDGEDMDSLQWI